MAPTALDRIPRASSRDCGGALGRWRARTSDCTREEVADGLQMSTLNALMSLLRTESNFLTSLHPNRTAQFASSTFALIVKGLLLPPDDELLQEDTREEWQKWFNKCDDVRFYFLKEATCVFHRPYKHY